jgi:hypothetical protein
MEYGRREEYYHRFMMLFIPFRALKDNMEDASSYQSAFLALVVSNRISENIATFANNIQDIHNSLRVDMPPNMLSDRTDLEEEEDENNQPINSTTEEEARLLATIAKTMAATANSTIPLSSAATDVTPNFLDATTNVPMMNMETVGEGLQTNTVVFETCTAQTGKTKNTAVKFQNRFATSVVELNTLVYKTLLVPANANEHLRNPTANATGSRDSIVKWGKQDGLDKNQQIAFEILVATYVLTFHEDATGTETLQERQTLKCLARQRPNKNEKLRMFITGPAGAGKCKLC